MILSIKFFVWNNYKYTNDQRRKKKKKRNNPMCYLFYNLSISFCNRLRNLAAWAPSICVW